MLIDTGFYIGDGTSSRDILTALGNVPLRVVLVKGFSAAQSAALFKTPTMGTNTLQLTANVVAGAITLGNGKFTVSADNRANASGVRYDWIALSDADGLGDLTYGTYSGDGTASRDVLCTLNPVLVIVKAESGQSGVFKITQHTGGNSSLFAALADATLRVISLGTGKFTVGSNAQVNATGVAIHWVAVAASAKVFTDAYTGNGVDNRDLPTTNMARIIAAFVKVNSTAFSVYMRTSTYADDSSTGINDTSAIADAIQRFNVDKVDVGTNGAVNLNAATYRYFAFGSKIPPSGDEDMELIRHRGATSQLITIYLRNSNTGAGLSGLTNATSGLTAYYTYNGDSGSHVISLASGTLGAWSSGGFKEVDATNQPGIYQLGVPDAALANGLSVDIVLQGAANLLENRIHIQLTVSDLDDGTALGISRIDAAISSRSTYAGGDTSGVTTLLSRIAAALTITSGKVDVNDKTGFALTSGEHTNIASDAQTGLTAQGYTTTRAGYLDTLNGLVNAIWSATTRTLTAISDSTGITTLLSRIAAAITITGGKVDVNDKTGFSLVSAYDPAKTAAQLSGIQAALDLLQAHGDLAWSTANVAALLTTSAFNTAITGLETYGNAHWTTADVSALLTAAAFNTAITDLITHGDANWESGGGDQWATILDGTYTGSQAGAIVLAILTKALLISDGTQIVVTSPNLPGTNDIILVHNNDYTVGSGRTLPQWTSTDWAAFDLLNAQSVTLYTQSADTPISLIIPVDVIDSENISVEISAETFESLEVTTAIAQRAVAPSKHVYSIEAVLADGSHETLVQGNVFIVGSKS